MPCLVLGRKAHVFYEVRFFEKVVLSLVVFWISSGQKPSIFAPHFVRILPK